MRNEGQIIMLPKNITIFQIIIKSISNNKMNISFLCSCISFWLRYQKIYCYCIRDSLQFISAGANRNCGICSGLLQMSRY